MNQIIACRHISRTSLKMLIVIVEVFKVVTTANLVTFFLGILLVLDILVYKGLFLVLFPRGNNIRQYF